MSRHSTLLMVTLLASFATVVRGQSPPVQPPGDADFNIRVYGYFDSATLQAFGRQMRGYLELRDSLQVGLPVLKITIDPDEIEQAEKLLAGRIRAARKAARRGDMFVGSLQKQIRGMLVIEVDARTLAALMDDNPGEFRFTLNGAYPKNRPLSTMPPNLLAILPALADGVEYRFVGRHLILRDTRANVVLDTIPYAIHCHDCDDDDDDDDDGEEDDR